MFGTILLAFVCVALAGAATVDMGGIRTDARLLCIVSPPGASLQEEKAAATLQLYLERVTGVRPGIEMEDPGLPKRCIFVGRARLWFSEEVAGELGPDGFFIQIDSGRVIIAGGEHKGTLYGVFGFLERFAGVRFLAPGIEKVPVSELLTLPVLQVEERPAFAFREVAYAGMDDPEFAGRMRCDQHTSPGPGEEEWGMWVHTMFRLVPPERYFASHPEYYALMGGARCTTQLCLSNPEVLRITIESLREMIREKPGAKYWSVSQMDTYGNCECDQCRATDRHEDSPAGSMIRFVNQVAAAFPGRVISTLAYQYTRKPPRHIRPAANVNVMLCTIECDRSKPIDADTSEGSFVSHLRGWSEIAPDILVWDYVIQFTNMIAPFPNLAVLGPNLKLFRKYGVRAVFEQGCRGTYSENQELRRYLLARLLWNPDLDVDSLVAGFAADYYGNASPYILQYHRAMAEALRYSGKNLTIYGSPMQETDAFLDQASLSVYENLFTLARAAVAGDPEQAARVEMARLPLQYARIEVSKRYITGPGGFLEPAADGDGYRVIPGMETAVGDFVQMAVKYGVKTVHERSKPPEVYGQETLDFFKRAWSGHLARGKPYTLAHGPAGQYGAEGPGSLTDGKRGSANYFVLWQGFEENDLVAVIDLGAPVRFNYAGAEFLQETASWIFCPLSLVVSVSGDGSDFREAAVVSPVECNDPSAIREAGAVFGEVEARYVRFHARNTGRCPPWHIGHGGKAWLFVDELIVDRR